MQRKPSHPMQSTGAPAPAVAAGLVLGLLIETTHAVTRSVVAASLATLASIEDCVDSARECGAGVETGCIHP